MIIIQTEPNPGGGYPPLQSWSGAEPPEGFLEFPEEFYGVFYPADKTCGGFVDLTVEAGRIRDVVWNEEAYQTYLSALPEPSEPVPTLEARMEAVEAEKADRQDVQAVWETMAAALSGGVNSIDG